MSIIVSTSTFGVFQCSILCTNMKYLSIILYNYVKVNIVVTNEFQHFVAYILNAASIYLFSLF